MFTPLRGLGVSFILTCNGRFYPRRCSDTRSPCINFISFIPSSGLHSCTEREGRCLRAAMVRPSAAKDQGCGRDLASLWFPAPPVLHLRMRNPSRGAKLVPAPPRPAPRTEAPPRYVPGRSTAARPALRSAPPGCAAGAGPRVHSRRLLLPTCVRACAEPAGTGGSALPFVSGDLSDSGA